MLYEESHHGPQLPLLPLLSLCFLAGRAAVLLLGGSKIFSETLKQTRSFTAAGFLFFRTKGIYS